MVYIAFFRIGLDSLYIGLYWCLDVSHHHQQKSLNPTQTIHQAVLNISIFQQWRTITRRKRILFYQWLLCKQGRLCQHSEKIFFLYSLKRRCKSESFAPTRREAIAKSSRIAWSLHKTRRNRFPRLSLMRK